jgi:hypothetical protein
MTTTKETDFLTLCPACTQDMATATTCTADRSGVTRYGHDVPGADWYLNDVVPNLPPRCRDCGVHRDGVHHQWCCVALCTNCTEQRLTCGCDN